MTEERDFDRIVRAWLELSADEAPDHAVFAVLQAVESTPQVRRPLRRPVWRFPDMKRLPIAAGVAAVLVLAIGGGLWLSSRPSVGTIPPSPSAQPTSAQQTPAQSSPATPGPTPSASPVAADIPTALRYHWVGQARDVPTFGTSARTALKFVGPTLSVTGTDYGLDKGILTSDVTVPAAGRLDLVLEARDGGCAAGDRGSYTWSTSPGGSILTVAAVGSDPCASRAAAVSGTWYRDACKDASDGCFGDIDPGTYPSQYIAPRLADGAPWVPDLGALTYTVPAGWSNSSDWPDTFTLTPAADYALQGPSGSPTGTAHVIGVDVDPAATKQLASCANSELTGVPRTVDGLIGYLRGLSSLTVSKPTGITIDGRAGKWVDVKIAPNWTKSCPDVPGGVPVAGFLMRHAGDPNAYQVGILGPERIRLIFLDLGGRVVLVTIDSTDAAGFDPFVAQAMPIIQTFHFR